MTGPVTGIAAVCPLLDTIGEKLRTYSNQVRGSGLGGCDLPASVVGLATAVCLEINRLGGHIRGRSMLKYPDIAGGLCDRLDARFA
jgi:hypothetical protein